MAVEIVWRRRAIRHLSEIGDHLQSRSRSAAGKYISGLHDACLSLAEFPGKAPRYDDRYRMLVYRNHLVFYIYLRVRQRIVIAAILDGRRDVQSLIDGLSD